MTIMVCTFFSVAVIAAQSETFKTGDANLDCVVNIKDATLIQKHIAEIATIDQKAVDLADVDANGSVNVKDATLIQKFVAGIVTEFPAKTPEEETTGPTTEAPSNEPTTAPSELPTEEPTEKPTEEPTTEPSTKPSVDPDGYYNDIVRP